MFHINLDELTAFPPGVLSSDAIVSLWEMANIKNATNLLEDLGFNDKEINLTQLIFVIDEEQQHCHDDKELLPLLKVSHLILL